jgi:hypothetical protein
MDNQKIFDGLVEARRRIDAAGLRLAQKGGRLLEYLADDLKKAGVDPKSVKLPKMPRSGGPLDIFEHISNCADAVFEQLFNESSQGLDRSFYDDMTELQPFQKTLRVLKRVKVICVLATPVLILLSLGNFAANSAPVNSVKGAVFAVLAADSLRVAYNCYARHYIAKCMKSFGGDGEITKLGSTLLQWASSSVGIGKGDDKLSRFKKGVLWEIIFKNTICFTVLKMVSVESILDR